jgi:hypothetical protein
MSTQSHLIDLPNGREAEFRLLEHDRDDDGVTTARLEIQGPDGRRWRLSVEEDVSQRNEDWNIGIIASYDRNGKLADVDLPDWIDDVLMRLR